MPEAKHEVFQEPHDSPSQLAKRWGFSPDTIRRIAINEPGVLVYESPRKHNRRPYKSIRIPASVARRIHERLSIKRAELEPRALDSQAPSAEHGQKPLHRGRK